MPWSIGNDVVARVLHFLPHLQRFFFDVAPLRSVPQGTYIDVSSSDEFSEEKSDANSGVDGILNRVDDS